MLGERLKRLRKERKWSQSKLQEKSGVNQGFISEIESGKKAPGIDTIKALATAFGLSVGDILTGDGEVRLPPYKSNEGHGLAGELGPLSADEYEMIDLFRALCVDQRKMALGYLRYVANESRGKEKTGGGSDFAGVKSA